MSGRKRSMLYRVLLPYKGVQEVVVKAKTKREAKLEALKFARYCLDFGDLDSPEFKNNSRIIGIEERAEDEEEDA